MEKLRANSYQLQSGLYEFARSLYLISACTALIHRHGRSPFPKGKVGVFHRGDTFNGANCQLSIYSPCSPLLSSAKITHSAIFVA